MVTSGIAGNPIYDAIVSARGPSSDTDWTGSCGLYSLTLQQPGVYTIQVSKTGYVTPAPTTLTLPPSRADLDFTLAPLSGNHATVSGTVRDRPINRWPASASASMNATSVGVAALIAPTEL